MATIWSPHVMCIRLVGLLPGALRVVSGRNWPRIVMGPVRITYVRDGAKPKCRLNWMIGFAAVLGSLIAIGLWWVYFDSVSHHLPRPGTAMVSA